MAINDVSRNLGPSKSQSHTSEAIGHAEDLSKIITNIDPDMTFFMSRFGEGADATSLNFSWLTEHLEPPKVNAQLEEHDYTSGRIGSLRGMSNHVQFFSKSGRVTDAQRKVAKIYSPDDEKAHLMKRVTKQMARDMEYAITKNAISRPENGSAAAMTGGVPFFMKSETISCTLSTSDGVVTTASEHNLKTGDFVYFKAATVPTGLKIGEAYYIRLNESDPLTKFKIYNTLQGAVEGLSADQVKPSTAGTELVIELNNIVDLAGAADYTLDDINKGLEMVYRRGGNPTIAVMSAEKKRTFSKLITAATTINRGMKADRKLDLVATAVETDYGMITAETHRMYDHDRIDILDMSYWDIKWFDRVKEVSGLPKKGTFMEFILEGSFGLQATQPLASCSILNIKR